jgi:hypothetical protein
LAPFAPLPFADDDPIHFSLQLPASKKQDLGILTFSFEAKLYIS